MSFNFSDNRVMRKFVVFGLISLFSLVSYSQTLEDAILLISKKDYQGAISMLKSLNQDRKVSYYLSEAYFLNKDFENTADVSKKVISQKGDFYYQKALYNLVFSSYMLNRFSDTYIYGLEYLEKVGDRQGVESSILTFVITSLQLSGEIEKAQELLEKYKTKYPNLYLVLYNSINKYKSQEKLSKKQNDEEKIKEIEKLNALYAEIIKDLLSSLDKISSKRDSEIEKLENIISLLELKEEILKLRKYKLIIGE